MTKSDSPDERIARLESQLVLFVNAAKQVLSDIDDDGIVERHDMGILALRKAVLLCPSEEIQCVLLGARRVHAEFGANSSHAEWVSLRQALEYLDGWVYSPTS